MAKDKSTAPKAEESFFDTDVALPAVTRVGAGGESPDIGKMKALPLIADASKAPASYFVLADVPDSITDEAERKRAGKEAARKITSRLSGASRRITKNDTTYAFALRTMEGTDKATGKSGIGVRVFRVPVSTAPASAAT